ncbi:MAG: hypothetical protein MPN21_04550 [Thermoanaerobaculia bacterium]|nr:hypothetical protein [Thermoanaerobaculia bacterium]
MIRWTIALLCMAWPSWCLADVSDKTVDAFLSDDYDVWSAAASELAAQGDEGVDWILAQRNREHLPLGFWARARQVLKVLPRDVALRRFPRLLELDEPALVSEVAWASAELQLAELRFELEAALQRGQHSADEEFGLYSIAAALDSLVPTKETSKRILAAARVQAPLRHGIDPSLYQLAYSRAPKAFSTEERLDYLLEVSPAAQDLDRGPGIFEIDPTQAESLHSAFGAEDLQFLTQHRVQVVERLVDDLETRGSRLAAVLLAWLGEDQILPELRRQLLLAQDTYGWETSTPLLFSEHNHRGYHAFSRAIETLTGQPLENAVELDPSEVDTLAARNDGTALLLLYRLAPEVARSRVFELFRYARSHSCLAQGNTIRRYDLLPPGTTIREAQTLLGPPDRTRDGAMLYCCGGTEWAGDFRLRIANETVVAFESESNDSDEAPPRWCR